MVAMTNPTFQRETRPPSRQPPADSWDCQAHVFGDPQRYPLRQGRSYQPPENATIEALARMHRALGIARGVIVQSTAHGNDHRILIDALAGRPKYRGVAIVDDTVDDATLLALHEAGVRGARFNFWKALGIAPDIAGFKRTLDRIRAFGWHARIHALRDDLLGMEELLKSLRVPTVVDHLANVDVTRGLDQPVCRLMSDLLQREHCWLMLSSSDRLSALDSGWEDVVALARAFIAAAPDRVIWSTDWPHVWYQKKAVPNDAELLELLYRFAPDPLQLKKVLVDNPARLLDG